MSVVTPMHKTVELYAGSTLTKRNLVAEVTIPRFLVEDPDVILWGSRYFKRSGDVDANQNWRYVECFVYAAPEGL